MKEIVQDGAEVLRSVAAPVPEELFGGVKLAHIVADMTAALDPEIEGVALAAPQIGIPYRIFIVRADRTLPLPLKDSRGGSAPTSDVAVEPPRAEVQVYINPEILKTSRRRAKMEEGCLSIRGVYGTTKRHERITIRARDISGKKFQRGAGGLMAQIFEHEIDHLNGVLFIDHAEHLIHMTHEHSA